MACSVVKHPDTDGVLGDLRGAAFDGLRNNVKQKAAQQRRAGEVPAGRNALRQQPALIGAQHFKTQRCRRIRVWNRRGQLCP